MHHSLDRPVTTDDPDECQVIFQAALSSIFYLFILQEPCSYHWVFFLAATVIWAHKRSCSITVCANRNQNGKAIQKTNGKKVCIFSEYRCAVHFNFSSWRSFPYFPLRAANVAVNINSTWTDPFGTTPVTPVYLVCIWVCRIWRTFSLLYLVW